MLGNDFLKLISFIKFWGFCFVIYVYFFFFRKIFAHLKSFIPPTHAGSAKRIEIYLVVITQKKKFSCFS